jgi:DNA repair protein RecO (recombination protein O)
MRRRIELEPAYVLAQRPYRETSLLLEILSRNEGRIGLVARGARGPKSKQRGLLQPFAPLLLSWSESGDLGTLTAAEAAGPAVMLDGERIFHGWYLNELLVRLLQRHDPHPALYEAYGGVLPALQAADDEPALRQFELALLAELGYGLDLSGELDRDATYRYDFDRGVVPVTAGGAEVLSGAGLIALREGRLAACDSGQRREVRNLLRTALQRQLGGRPLETPQLLRALRAKLHVSSSS